MPETRGVLGVPGSWGLARTMRQSILETVLADCKHPFLTSEPELLPALEKLSYITALGPGHTTIPRYCYTGG